MDHLLLTSWVRGLENTVALISCPGDRNSSFSSLKLAFLILVVVGTKSTAVSLPFGLCAKAEKGKMIRGN